MFKKADLIIYVIIILVIGSILTAGFGVGTTKADHVEVYEDGKMTYRFSLQEGRVEYRINSYLGEEIIVIENNKVKKIHATCPGKDCINHGEIENTGEVIICVPNKQVIKIKGESEDVDFILK